MTIESLFRLGAEASKCKNSSEFEEAMKDAIFKFMKSNTVESITLTNRNKFVKGERYFNILGTPYSYRNRTLTNIRTGQSFKGNVDTYTTAIGIHYMMSSKPNKQNFSEE